ncbi:ring-cleaving dioxygenase [Virgibacillus sp. 179-BFC.A HS]|uniref:Ring-cleaving dioxygenase n=1 Tax=Tigheibacillus jepli TaxID=3035914 RepID=A0ABU5CIE9_9BACI|nr:ring-cleaving dioxygenase [Virgibacillus sp. 179-BFC.A HS]MDY0406104.1 ring-cleaving dioxygenase [Virgibacillus sp. 179-BFC.A HS]
MEHSAGIHHISAIVGHPQENAAFYGSILGLRLVKKTVNFDDPGSYHLYFGNEEGKPGTIITFFPWVNAAPGKIGAGQVGTTAYATPVGAMPFWEKRLKKFAIAYTKSERFGETYLSFRDVHGLQLELVERKTGKDNSWSFGDITAETAIKGFAGATLLSVNPEKTIQLLTEVMGWKKIDENEDTIRFQSEADIGNILDIKRAPEPKGKLGAGTVHHIAFRTADQQEQLNWRRTLSINGYGVTPVKDRKYFTSVYFREHGEILFEIATDGPGFMIDENMDALGESLQLPPQYEIYRGHLNKTLLPIHINNLDKGMG